MPFPALSIAAIPSQGLRSSIGEWAKVAAGEGAEGEVLRLGGDIEVIRRGTHILARGQISLDARLPCARCRQPLDWSLESPFSVVYSPLAALAVHPEDDSERGPEVPSEFSGEAEDVGEYEGEVFDLCQVVREHCSVERPGRLRCVDLDPAADQACVARWKALVGSTEPGNISPFAVLQRPPLKKPTPES